ncbi:hypothetical protein QTP86_028678, partial [Hemibagrus guttatus]
ASTTTSLFLLIQTLKCFKCGQTGHLARACPERHSDPGVSERPGQDAAEPAGVVSPAAAAQPAAEGPGAAAAPDLTESQPQAQPAAQKPTGATPALEKPRTAEPATAEPRSARPDRQKPWSTERSSVGSGAVLEPPALTEAGAEVQGNRMETPDTTPVQGDRGDVDMVDEPIFKVPNKRKKQGKGQGKKQAKKETKVEERESDSDDCISDSVLTFDSQEEQVNVVYSAEDIKEFLRNTKWQKNVALEEFFPDRKQFIHDVKFFRREGAFVDVEIFRLKKLITRQTVSFYSKLYSSEWSGAQAVEDSFLVGLPKLSEQAARELDRELSLEELHEALQTMQNGRASGIDGLPAEFYKAFWAVIGQDVLDVLWDSIRREHVKGRLTRRKWLVPKMSYRGRTLVINNLTASSLWHKLACVDPPPNLLANIQGQLVDFFWDGLHWIPQSVLHLPKEEGGQGLVQLSSRAAAFHLQFIQRLLTGTRDLEPLVYGGRLDISGVTVPALSRTLVSSGIVMLRELVNVAGSDLSRPEDLAECMGLRSLRVVNQLLHRWRSALTSEERVQLMDCQHTETGPAEDEPFPRLNIAPDLDGCAGPLLECRSEGKMDF